MHTLFTLSAQTPKGAATFQKPNLRYYDDAQTARADKKETDRLTMRCQARDAESPEAIVSQARAKADAAGIAWEDVEIYATLTGGGYVKKFLTGEKLLIAGVPNAVAQ